MLFVNSKSVASYINARWMASSDAQNDIVLRIGGVLNVNQSDRRSRVELGMSCSPSPSPSSKILFFWEIPNLPRPWQPGALGTLQLCSCHGAGASIFNRRSSVSSAVGERERSS